MEINTSNLNNTLNIETAKIVEPSTTSTVATENSRTPTPPSTDTVSFSAAAIALSSTDNESTEIGPETDIDTQQQINQLQNNIAQDPSQAIFAQTGKVTDTVVKGLLG